MAIYRQIRLSFWQDDKVVDDFTPEDKYFMLYLMTNPHTNQVGCYPITIKQMEFETGYNKDTIEKLLKRFVEVLKVIKYSKDTKEIFICNWSKYNWTNSPKVLACILKEAESIKNSEFRYSINTLLKDYGKSIDIETQEKEKEKEKQKEKKEKKEFIKPTKEEIQEYVNTHSLNVDILHFIEYYDCLEWKGVKNWKLRLKTWSANQNHFDRMKNKKKETPYQQEEVYNAYKQY